MARIQKIIRRTIVVEEYDDAVFLIERTTTYDAAGNVTGGSVRYPDGSGGAAGGSSRAVSMPRGIGGITST